MAEILQGGLRDTNGYDYANPSNYTITNKTTDRTMDCNNAADAELADVLGTLIQDLIRKGIINGTVA
jgi:hypothetical protein